MMNWRIPAISLLILTGCVKDDDPVISNPGYEYFPTEIGSYIVYKADSIYHDQPVSNVPGIHDTVSYFIKELIESEYLDATDEPALRIVRYKRNSENEDWVLSDVWAGKRNSNNAERVEENVRIIKLAFPVSGSAKWNGNALNDLEEWEFSYDSLYRARNYGSLSFPKTITVDQRFFLTEVNDEFAFEVYAENVGLVYRKYKKLFTRPSYLNNRVAENIISGNEYTWQILEYGME